LFNQPIWRWNVSNVEDFQAMFVNVFEFNQHLDGWDTSSATKMTSMFSMSRAFNGRVPFNTARVTSMRDMFSSAPLFNQPVAFDTSAVTDLLSMFHTASLFNQPVAFDTTKVTDFSFMFFNALVFNQPVRFNVSSVAAGSNKMNNMFNGAAAMSNCNKLFSHEHLSLSAEWSYSWGTLCPHRTPRGSISWSTAEAIANAGCVQPLGLQEGSMASSGG